MGEGETFALTPYKVATTIDGDKQMPDAKYPLADIICRRRRLLAK